MIKEGRDELICDLAETYHIYDMKAFPVSLVSTLAFGLRDDSRIVLKMTKQPCSFDRLLRASLVDSVNILLYSKTKDAETGAHKPKSIVSLLTGKSDAEDNGTAGFETIEAFETARRDIIEHAERSA